MDNSTIAINDQIDSAPPAFKIYRDKIAFGVSYLGGPIAAGYVIAENFKAFGDNKKYRLTWIITVLFTLGLFGILSVIPESANIPNFIIPLTYSVVAQALMKNYQGKQITNHLDKGGLYYSGWRGLVIGLIGLALTISLIAPFAIYEYYSNETESYYQPYGPQKHEMVYDDDNISLQEVKYLGEQLAQVQFLDSTYTMHLYIDKEDDIIKLSIPFDSDAWNDQATISYYNELERLLKEKYKSSKIEVQLCNTYLEVKKSFK